MTDSAGKPNDINARLEALGEEIDLLRTEVSAVRVETGANTCSILINVVVASLQEINPIIPYPVYQSMFQIDAT